MPFSTGLDERECCKMGEMSKMARKASEWLSEDDQEQKAG